MRLQGSQTRLVGLGGDISRVKRESAGRREEEEVRKSGGCRSRTQGHKGTGTISSGRREGRRCEYVRACERAALVAVVEATRNVRRKL